MDAPDAIDLLLVEDNPNDLELTLRALRRRDLEPSVQVVKDGAEALEFIFATGAYSNRAGLKNPKVIFLDLKLPKVSGIDVLKKIKSTDQTRLIPVVVLTSSPQERDVMDSYHVGANSYIVKPVDFTKFAQVIADVGFYWLSLNQPPS